MEIIYRTCAAVSTKPRPEWYSKEACLNNLTRVFRVECRYHVIVDTQYPEEKPFRFPWAQLGGDIAIDYHINEQHNARAFLKALDYACTLDGDLYLVEDDFVHRPGAPEVLRGGLRRFDYVTGYDHPNKYGEKYEGIPGLCEPSVPVYRGEHCHYKSTQSTVMTFAVKADTLREDVDVWRKWSQERHGWTRDHLAFCELRQRGRTVGSSIPAYSTHCEPDWLAPLVDWEAVIRQ